MKVRTTIRGHRDDAGFSLVEVMFSTLILFVVATAILGMSSGASLMSVNARERAAMVNAVDSYLESVKAMEYDDLSTLPAETSMTVDGILVKIETTVEWVDDPNVTGTENYRLVTITASVEREGGDPLTFVTETQIRDRHSGWGWAEGAEPPVIDFSVSSPAALEVITGPTVLVGAVANSPMPNGVLVNVRFYTDTREMRDLGGYFAEWSPGTQSWADDFYWDTTAVDESSARISPDGIRTIKVEAWDNIGQQAYRLRQVIVDNSPPDAPGEAWLDYAWGEIDPVYGFQMYVRWAWDPVSDGTDPAYHYFVGMDQDQGTGVWVHIHEYCATDVIEQTFYEMPCEPFSRYRQRMFVGTYSAPPTQVGPTPNDGWVTPPRLTGVYDVQRTQSGPDAICVTENSLSWSTPSFPATAVEYYLYRSMSPDMSNPTLLFSSDSEYDSFYLDHIDKTGRKQDTFPDKYYYQLEATVLPTGPDGGTPMALVSNVAGPNAVVTDYSHVYGEMGETW